MPRKLAVGGQLLSHWKWIKCICLRTVVELRTQATRVYHKLCFKYFFPGLKMDKRSFKTKVHQQGEPFLLLLLFWSHTFFCLFGGSQGLILTVFKEYFWQGSGIKYDTRG